MKRTHHTSGMLGSVHRNWQNDDCILQDEHRCSRTRVVAVMLTAIFLAVCMMSLCACDDTSEKHRVTVSVWDESLLDSAFTQKVEELNPDYDIVWIRGDDSADFYQFQAKNGSMPDVVLMQHVDERSSATQEGFYNLQETSLTRNYDDEYLQQIANNTQDCVYWVPSSNGYVGLIANKYLFDLYKVDLPTDTQSFLDACETFEKNGITGVSGAFLDDDTMFLFSQTVLTSYFQSAEGNQWRSAYQQGSTNQFDDTSISYYEDIEQALSTGVLSDADFSSTKEQAENDFLAGNCAMLFVVGEDVDTYAQEYNMTVRAIPSFTSSELVAPAFYGGVSDVESEGVSVENSEESHEAALDVLSSIMSEEAQETYFSEQGLGTPYQGTSYAESGSAVFEALAQGGGYATVAMSDTKIRDACLAAVTNVLVEQAKQNVKEKEEAKKASEAKKKSASSSSSSNKTTSTSSNSSQGSSSNSAASGSVGASSNTNTQSGATVFEGSDGYHQQEPETQEAVINEWSFIDKDKETLAETCVKTANEALARSNEEKSLVCTNFAEGMSNIWNKDSGNMAGSAIAHNIANDLTCDFCIMSYASVRCPLYPGDMTETDITYPVAPDSVYTLTMTGAQLRELLAKEVENAKQGYTLPILSGLTMTVSQTGDGYELKGLQQIASSSANDTANPAGQSEHTQTSLEALDDAGKYTVAIAGPANSALITYATDAGAEKQSETLQGIWCNQFTSTENSTLLASMDYIEMN